MGVASKDLVFVTQKVAFHTDAELLLELGKRDQTRSYGD
jgi:hypothetical protein